MEEKKRQDVSTENGGQSPVEETGGESRQTEARKTSPQDRAAGSTIETWCRELAHVVRTKAFLIPVLLAIAVSVVILTLPVERFFVEEESPEVTPVGRIVYDMSSYLGYRHTVNFRLSVTYTSPSETDILKRKLPALKTALANAENLSEFQEAIETKNLNALENAIRALVHDVTGLPLKHLVISRLQLD